MNIAGPGSLPAQSQARDLRQTPPEPCTKRRLGNEVFFVSDIFAVTNPDSVSLYVASDAVLYPSLQEGVGIPLLEAAVHGLLFFAPPLSRLTIAVPGTELAEVVKRVVKETSNCRKDVLHRFTREAIKAGRMEPLTMGGTDTPRIRAGVYPARRGKSGRDARATSPSVWHPLLKTKL